MRAQRIKENMERMKILGIFDLSKKLNKTKIASSAKKKKKNDKAITKSGTSNDPPRRSSRLQIMTRVSYSELPKPKRDKVVANAEIHIVESSKPEVYTGEDVKLLGDSKTPWTLLADGYDNEGKRVYDPVNGKTCHQCRYMANAGCCKILSSLTEKIGFAPFVEGYAIVAVVVARKVGRQLVCKLGFKSVAHYLIQTHRGQQIKAEESGSENLVF
ncbi:hypothetical protein M9H77_12512 [Catharanthus roseus]|uniref:Uncharacterized protein n=1 Tax=Catharanthus roseus TaxID=4058 RepID=A0ACC0BHS6_CATRO|nr:hypothetical protein M9H77_12512 [Catharanthus roseus]